MNTGPDGERVSAVPGAGRAPVAEDPAILAANLNVGARLFASAVAFVFVAFVFAFFYLKTVNSNDNWLPHHISPAAGVGIAILVCVLASTAALFFASRSLLAGAPAASLATLAISLLFGIAVIVIQIAQYTDYGFSPEGGGYASVFVGWTAMFLVFWVGAVYWIETLLAQLLRGRSATTETELTNPSAVLGPSAAACLVFLLLMSGVEIIAYVLLYLVK